MFKVRKHAYHNSKAVEDACTSDTKTFPPWEKSVDLDEKKQGQMPIYSV